MEENNNKKLGIIDFGIVGNITREEQNIYYKFMSEIFVNKNYKNAAIIIIGQITTPIDKEYLNIIDTNCSDQIENIIQEGTSYGKDLDFYNCYKLNEVLAKCNLKLSPLFYKLQYSVGTCYSICINLSIDKPFLNNISEMCKDLLEFVD